MQTELTYLLIVLFSFYQSENQWTEQMLKTALEEIEIAYCEDQKSYTDSLGNIINIRYSEHDLNGDGRTELLVTASGSYYLWGVTESACFVLDQNREILLEISAIEISVADGTTNGCLNVCVAGRNNLNQYEWNENRYVFVH